MIFQKGSTKRPLLDLLKRDLGHSLHPWGEELSGLEFAAPVMKTSQPANGPDLFSFDRCFSEIAKSLSWKVQMPDP